MVAEPTRMLSPLEEVNGRVLMAAVENKFSCGRISREQCEIRRIEPRCEKKETLFKSTQVEIHLRNGLWPL